MKTVYGLILLVILALLGMLRILRPVEGFVSTPTAAPSLADAKFTMTALETACKTFPDVKGFRDKIELLSYDKKISLDKSMIELMEKASRGVVEFQRVCGSANRAKQYIDRLAPSVPKPLTGIQNLQAPNNLNMSGGK